MHLNRGIQETANDEGSARVVWAAAFDERSQFAESFRDTEMTVVAFTR